MAEGSILQSLGGALGGKRWEFRSRDIVVGSSPGCAVLIDAPGVEARHARIVIESPGATIFRLGGAVGVNDDLVTTAGLLRSGDFVWIGEPGGASSIMLQFTLGEVEEPAMASSSEAGSQGATGETSVEMGVSADPTPSERGLQGVRLEDEEPPPPAIEEVHAASVESPMIEAAIDGAGLSASRVEEAQPEPESGPPEQPEPKEAAPSEPTAVVASTDEIPREPPVEPEVLPEIELAPLQSAPIVPLPPWQVLSAAAAEPSAPVEYASAWESVPSAPVSPELAAPEDADATITLSKATPPAPSPPTVPTPTRPTPRPPSPSLGRRPAPPAHRIVPRTEEEDAVLRTPPPAPPARTTSSTPLVVGGLVTMLVAAGAGFLLLRPAPTSIPPGLPTPTPTVAAIDTPYAATPLPTQVPLVEPIATPPQPVSTPVTATPRAIATPLPRVTPTPRVPPPMRATPTPAPAPTFRPPVPAAIPAPPVAAPAATPSHIPRLLDEAQAAVMARDFARASQILDQALGLEPGNSMAAARKAEVEARRTSLARKFSVGATSVIGGKAAKGPTGFDLGGGAVVQTDFAAQVRCTTTPTSVEPGMRYSIRCSIVNIGSKGFRIETVAVNETVDGAKSAWAGVAPRPDITPQSDGVLLERVGAWAAKSQWSLEVAAKTTKGESFRAAYSWR